MNVSIKREHRILTPSAEQEKGRLRVNRIISLTLACLLHISLAVASTYNLRVEVTPNGSGTLNINGGTYEEGSDIYLRTYNNTGYVFLGWYEGDVLLSSSTNFDYTMPANDVLVQARYEYDPEVPADPDQMSPNYTVTVACKPIGGGTFNTNGTTMEGGEEIHLYAYTNTGYHFLHWENEAGDIISTEQDFDYVMPHHNSRIYGIFEYNPEVPGNPNKNSWNKTTGEMIVDDFTPGNLNNTIYQALGDSYNDEVTMLIVAGQMNGNDFGIANNFYNCTLLDLSRTYGYSDIPNYACDYNSNLQHIILPAEVENIGQRAFYWCDNLSEVTCHAAVPPTVGRDAFNGISENAVLYVRPSSISSYAEADGWKDFTILPIDEDICNISVSFPEESIVGDYAQMWLELTNTMSGQRMHYVMTDRTQYTFPNIISNTTWTVTLRNERGDVFGQIENIEVKDEDVSVTFGSLSKPQSVVLSVFTPDGQDVTEHTQVTWTDAQGNYLAQGVSLAGLPVGYQTTYDVTLSQELAMVYNIPQPVDYMLVDGSNKITCQLSAIPQVKILGKVKDASTGFSLSKSVISVSQTFGGKYSQTFNAKTDGKGLFELNIANIPTSVTFSAFDYVSQTINCDSLLTGVEEIALPEVLLEPISGATIKLNLTYTTCDGETQNWYSDYQNVSYELFNVTRNQIISQYNVQYPQIVILEEIADGDVLKLTATSRTNAFMPVVVTDTIEGQKAQVSFGIAELGKIHSSFASTSNAIVVGSLYNAAGKLLDTNNYSEDSLIINDLTDGEYTLITMGSSRLFNTVYDLAQLPQTGLIEGKDYVLNKVDVKSGAVSAINISEVPTLDESKFYYTGDNTSFMVNKQSIVAGNYLTLTGHIDFKQAHVANVSNVNLIVDLPESCEFIENSVMVGNSISSYTLNDHQITIPLTNYSDRVRFCITPTTGGNYAPSAFVQFNLDNKTITQPIGSANFTANDISISVASTVAEKNFIVSGMATRQSTVEIYDNGMLVGQTETLQNGAWQATCTLYDAYNLSEHAIHAIIYRKDGLALQTETHNVFYDKDAVVPKTVLMSFYNAYLRRNVEVVFDLQKASSSASSYSFYKPAPFTFIADLSNNDTTVVNDVYIHVYTSDEKVTSLRANYNEEHQCWMAVQEFTAHNLPVNVSVTVDYNSPLEYDEEYANEAIASTEEEIAQIRLQSQSIDELYDELNSELGKDSIDLGVVQTIVEAIIKQENELLGYNTIAPDADFAQKVDQAKSYDEILTILNEFSDTDSSGGDQLYSDFELPAYEIEDGLKIPSIKIHCSEPIFSEKDLLSIYQEVYATGFNGNWVVNFDEIGIITLSNNGMSFTVDLREVINIPTCSIEDEDTFNEYIEVLTDYFEKLGSFDFEKNCEQDSERALCQYMSNYHYALRTLYSDSLIQSLNSYSSKTRGAKKGLRGPGLKMLGGKLKRHGGTILGFINDIKDSYQDEKSWDDTIDRIKYKCASSNRKGLEDKAREYQRQQRVDNIKQVAKGTLLSIFHDMSSGYMSTGLLGVATGVAGSWPILVAGGILTAASYGAGICFDLEGNKSSHDYNRIRESIEEECCPQGTCTLPPPPTPQAPPTQPIIDPSGYVYEGVSSNRLEGVTATVYYKETVEDMYGDLHENVVKWDAEEYAQKNPLFTDENGMYAWDVPQGLWQVKLEYEGYETTYSDWLPVPPPQLDVNIAMTQYRQPQVKMARAYEDAVEVEFDKYMIPEQLTADNIMVVQNGTAVEGSVQLLNEEVSYKGETTTFASKVRFNAAQPFTAKEVTLLISNRVKSYAGVRMQDNYEQTFDIEPEVKAIVADSLVSVYYGSEHALNVKVLPVTAAAGKILLVSSSSPMILEVDAESIVLDDNGEAVITVSGKLPGMGAINYSIAGYDHTVSTIVEVDYEDVSVTANPTASITSGTTVAKGTGVTLSCSSEGAAIYYTLDGSCPCDDTAILYDGTPIVINENTELRIMAVAEGRYESDVVIYHYYVEGANVEDVVLPLSINPTIVRTGFRVQGVETDCTVSVYGVAGELVLQREHVKNNAFVNIAHAPEGMYIVMIMQGDVIYKQRILKVE